MIDMDWSQLQNRIARLEKAEFEAFCAQFGVDGEALDGRAQAERASEFVMFMMRHGRLPEVTAALPGKERETLSQTAELEAALGWLDDIAAGKGSPLEEPPTVAWSSDLHDTPMADALDTLAGLDTAVFDENVTMSWRKAEVSPFLPAANPYSISVPVTTDKMFFGREEELAFLQARLKGMQSTAVIGLRHMGKSSLLLRLCRHAPSPDYLMAYVDMRDDRFHTVAGLLNSILRQWERAVAAEVKQGQMLPGRNYQALGPALLPTAADVRQFAQRVRQLRQSGYRPVICLDEFALLAQRQSIFDDAFLNIWHALAANQYLAFVIASTQPLTYLLKQNGLRPGFGKPFAMRPLGLLSSAAAAALLTEPARQFGVTVQESGVEFMLERCGRHPFFLQMGGFFLFDGLRLAQADWETIGHSFAWQAEPYWRALWDSLNRRHQALLTRPLPPNPPLVAQRQRRALAQLGLLVAEGDDFRPFSQGFADWLAARKQKADQPESSPESEDEGEMARPSRSGLMQRLRGMLGGGDSTP